jgi:hypothetical protein
LSFLTLIEITTLFLYQTDKDNFVLQFKLAICKVIHILKDVESVCPAGEEDHYYPYAEES